MTSTVRPPAGRTPRRARRPPAPRASTGVAVRAPADVRDAERPVDVRATPGGLRQAVREDPPRPRVGTVVVRYLYGTVAGSDVAVLAIDPDTLPATAYWRGSFADRPLPELLDGLRRPAPGGGVAALVVDPRGELGDGFTVQLGDTARQVRQVAAARLFPGRRLPVPMVVVDRSQLGTVDAHAGTRNELWTRGEARPAQAADRTDAAAVLRLS